MLPNNKTVFGNDYEEELLFLVAPPCKKKLVKGKQD